MRIITESLSRVFASRLSMDHPSLYVANSSVGCDTLADSGIMSYKEFAICPDRSREQVCSLEPDGRSGL